MILSGTGSDGARGVRAIKEMGGMVMVQSEESAKFNGMPRAAISTGVADFILTAEEMPAQILAYIAHPFVSGEKHADLLQGGDAMTRLFAELRDKTKVDFTHYKPSTITRRIERRISINQIADIEDYVHHLQTSPDEAQALYRDLLIGVTCFFRDQDAMQELEEHHLPELLKRVNDREIRFWVSGCATGEEAYSLAIMAREVMEQHNISRDIKIFATDIDRDAIITASHGIYPDSIAGDLPHKVLTKYFYHKEEKLQIARNIREMVVFAQHNVVKDPPFTNIDLISCRNLLIYLQPVLQQKVFEMFNFSLNPKGLLFLGSSETTGHMEQYFETLHGKFKIYSSRGKNLHLKPELELSREKERHLPSGLFPGRLHRQKPADNDPGRIMERYVKGMAEKYLPLSVVVNEQMEIIHIIGETGDYFRLSSGPASFDIARMVDPALAIPLATGIKKVFRTGKDLSFSNVQFPLGNSIRRCRLLIKPLPPIRGEMDLAVVLFEELEEKQPNQPTAAETYDVDTESRQRIQDLEQELQFARENLQATIEELETSNEELQATNEELLASNEELQSTNEELQSTNEELYTVNAEHQSRIIELTELNNDVDNLLTSSGIGTLLLDENLMIRKFSPQIAHLFPLLEKDIGRPINNITNHLIDFDPVALISQVQQTERVVFREAQNAKGQWFLVRIIPYAIGPKDYSGVVMTCVDITDARKDRKELAESRNKVSISEKRYQNLMESVALGIIYQDETGKVFYANSAAEKLLGLTLDQMADGEWSANGWQAISDSHQPLARDELPGHKVLETGSPIFGYILGVRTTSLETTRWLLINATPKFRQSERKPYQSYSTIEDISERFTRIGPKASAGQ